MPLNAEDACSLHVSVRRHHLGKCSTAFPYLEQITRVCAWSFELAASALFIWPAASPTRFNFSAGVRVTFSRSAAVMSDSANHLEPFITAVRRFM
jgi:hypothetical protein